MSAPLFRIELVWVDVLEHLQQYALARGFDVLEGPVELSEDMSRFTKDGQIHPTVVVEEPITAPEFRNRGIVGPRSDTSQMTIMFLMISPDFRWLIRLHDLLRDCLIGYAPEGCGEMNEDRGGSVGPVSSAMAPTRYADTVGFTMTVGTIVVS